MIIAITLIFLLLAVVFCHRFSGGKSGFKLNFFLFFTIGYVYYSISPIVFYSFLESFTQAEFEIIKNSLDGVDENNVVVYGMFSLFFYIAFVVGYSIPRGRIAIEPVLIAKKKSRSIIFLYLSILLAMLAALPISSDFFKGYSEDVFVGYNEGVLARSGQRGTFIAAVTVLFGCYLFHVSSHYTAHLKGSALAYYVKNKFFVVYLFFAILMLSLGGRLYFVSHIIALLVMANFQRPYTVSHTTLIFCFFGLAAASGFYGLFRASSELNILGIFVNLLQEPLYTSISLFTYLGQNRIESLNAPVLLLSDFKNLLPSFFWPDKAQYILKPEDLGYSIQTPLGGFHFFVSLCINFGYIGSIFIMFIFGYAMALINGKTNRYTYGVLLSMLTAWSTFSLFRDPFSVSVVKNMFQYSLMFTFLMVAVNRLKI